MLVAQLIRQKHIPKIIPPFKRMVRDKVIPDGISLANPLKHTQVEPLKIRQHLFLQFLCPIEQVNPFWIKRLINRINFHSVEGLSRSERNSSPRRAPASLLAASKSHWNILLDFRALHKSRGKLKQKLTAFRTPGEQPAPDNRVTFLSRQLKRQRADILKLKRLQSHPADALVIAFLEGELGLLHIRSRKETIRNELPRFL